MSARKQTVKSYPLLREKIVKNYYKQTRLSACSRYYLSFKHLGQREQHGSQSEKRAYHRQLSIHHPSYGHSLLRCALIGG